MYCIVKGAFRPEHMRAGAGKKCQPLLSNHPKSFECYGITIEPSVLFPTLTRIVSPDFKSEETWKRAFP